MYYRDSHGNITCRIDENSTTKYIYDAHGSLLATYNKSVDLTVSASGSVVVKGDQLMMFMKCQKQ